MAGRFAGLAFDALSQAQLLELLNDFAGEDDESAALLGAWIGHRVQLRMEESTFRKVVSAALVLIGLTLVGGRLRG